MKTKELNNLLEKYYEGETSEAEELVLRKFFDGNNVPPGYEAEMEIFGYYSGLDKIPEPSADLEEKILAGVDKRINGESLIKKRRFVLSLLSAAAGVLILAGSYYFFVQKTEPMDTFSDPELAYAETMKILYNVSSRLNQGTNSLEPLGKMQAISSKSFEAIDRSTTLIEEKMKSLSYIRKAMNIINFPTDDSINK